MSRRSQRTEATSRRSIRSVGSLKLEEEAKAAELEVKLKYHQIEAAAAKMKIEQELDITKARLQVFKEEYSGDSGSEGLSDEEPSDTKVRR